jgi:hypothetical protein
MKIVLLLVSILLLSSCDVLQPEETTTAKKRRKLFQTLWYPYIFTITEYTNEQTIIDNKDGTLTYSNIRYETKFGTIETGRIEILYQRCLMGQVYRSAQNDCQGTGTKATVWGAQKYQWCPTNDKSCEDSNGNAISPASPAAKACADSSFQGKKWEMPNSNQEIFFDYNQSSTKSYSTIFYKDYPNYFQDFFINTVEEYGVWDRVSYDDQKTNVEYYSTGSRILKNLNFNVNCKEKK